MSSTALASLPERLHRTLRPPVLVAVGVFGGLAALGASNLMPSTIGYTCPFKALTGYNCPGCGASRCINSLVHGHFLQAAHYNLFLLLMLPVIGWTFYRWYRADRAGQSLPQPNVRLVLTLFALMMVFAVVRNIPGMPFIHLN